MKYQHIIWDWNGTIINDAPAVVKTINCLLAAHNLNPITEEFLQMNFSHPVINLYNKLGFDTSPGSFDLLCMKFFEIYRELSRSSDLHSGIVETLALIKKSGITQSILSAHPHEYLEEDVAHKQIAHYFSDIVGSSSKDGKGKIETAILWIENSPHIKEKQIVFIGDTDHDLETAREIGVDCILVAKGMQDYSRLKKLGCVVVNEIEEIRAYLEIS